MTTTVTGRIDAAVSSRLAASAYVAPDNTGISEANAHAHAIDARLPSDPADESLLEAAIAGIGGPGSGAVTWTYTLTSDVDAAPISGADVWVTNDSGGSNLMASGTTDGSGVVTFYLDAGTYYVWRRKAGWNFTNPDTEVVAAP